MRKLNRILTVAVVCGAVVLGGGCAVPTIEELAREDGRGCVSTRFSADVYGGRVYYTPAQVRDGTALFDNADCEKHDVLRWKDADGAIFQRVIAANRCPMRIALAWCMGGGDGEAKACGRGVLPPNGAYKSDPYDASEMNGTYTFRRMGSTIPANDKLCLPRGGNKNFADTRYVHTANSMKQTVSGQGGKTVVNIESGTGVKGAVGRGVGNVIEDMTESMIWDALLN